MKTLNQILAMSALTISLNGHTETISSDVIDDSADKVGTILNWNDKYIEDRSVGGNITLSGTNNQIALLLNKISKNMLMELRSQGAVSTFIIPTITPNGDIGLKVDNNYTNGPSKVRYFKVGEESIHSITYKEWADTLLHY